MNGEVCPTCMGTGEVRTALARVPCIACVDGLVTITGRRPSWPELQNLKPVSRFTVNCGFCRGVCTGNHYISQSSEGY